MRLVGDNKFKLLTEGGLWNAPSIGQRREDSSQPRKDQELEDKGLKESFQEGERKGLGKEGREV
jgi:hypothetical protein